MSHSTPPLTHSTTQDYSSLPELYFKEEDIKQENNAQSPLKVIKSEPRKMSESSAGLPPPLEKKVDRPYLTIRQGGVCQCLICLKRYINAEALETHLITIHSIDLWRPHRASEHLTGRKYSYQHCSYWSVRQSNLNTHLHVHSGVWPFQCEASSSKSFRTLQGLKYHSNIHNIHECVVCDKAFSSQSALAEHELSLLHRSKVALTVSCCIEQLN